MKLFTFTTTLVILAILNINLCAQGLGPPLEDDDVGFADLNNKFIRNMKVLTPLLDEDAAVKLMDALVGQASGLSRFYQSKNADTQRENILKKTEDSLTKKTLRSSDIEKIEKLRKALRKRDPDNQFSNASQQVLLTSEALNKTLDQIFTNDPQQKDIIRITKKHIQLYRSAIFKLRQGLNL